MQEQLPSIRSPTMMQGKVCSPDGALAESGKSLVERTVGWADVRKPNDERTASG